MGYKVNVFVGCPTQATVGASAYFFRLLGTRKPLKPFVYWVG